MAKPGLLERLCGTMCPEPMRKAECVGLLSLMHHLDDA